MTRAAKNPGSDLDGTEHRGLVSDLTTGSDRRSVPMYLDVGNAAKWWLIPAKQGSICTGCGNPIAERSPATYCHERAETMCAVCTDRHGVDAQPSRRWLRMRALENADRDTLRVKCPRHGCWAAEGEHCVEGKHKRDKVTPHAARKRLAAAEQDAAAKRVPA